MMKFCSSCGGSISYRVPEGDNRERAVCGDCGRVHYRNPLVVVGCVPERDGKILMCKRAIEPRYGYWTLPAGFMELGETVAAGAARETLEEARATVELGHLFACVDVVDAGQVHLFYTAKLVSDFGAGDETLEAKLVSADEIPWEDMAFESVAFALRKYLEDRGENNGVHTCALRRTHH